LGHGTIKYIVENLVDIFAEDAIRHLWCVVPPAYAHQPRHRRRGCTRSTKREARAGSPPALQLIAGPRGRPRGSIFDWAGKRRASENTAGAFLFPSGAWGLCVGHIACSGYFRVRRRPAKNVARLGNAFQGAPQPCSAGWSAEGLCALSPPTPRFVVGRVR